MAIIEALLRRRVSRLAVSIEMILVLASLLVITFLLARTGLEMPFPMMLIPVSVVAGLYVRALRLNEALGPTDQKKGRQWLMPLKKTGLK